ncbi:MAG: glycosyltransferase [Myxococcota bacterium]
MLEVFFIVIVVLSAASMATTLASHVSLHLTVGRRPCARAYAPSISILKPLKGHDEGLHDNLVSLVTQQYPGRFEVLLGAADADDPALAVARRIRRAYPEVCIRIVPGRSGPGLNPKVANLDALSSAARFPNLLVSDSNVRVGPEYLRRTAAELHDERVGLVSNVLVGTGERSFGATLENLHLGSFVAGAVCGAQVLANHPVVVGKSMLMRRQALEDAGGFRGVEDVLGEDYLLGRKIHDAGHRVVLSAEIITTCNERWPARQFLARHLRWSQMRRWIAPPAYACEPLLNPIPTLMVAAAFAALHSGSLLSLSSTLWVRAALLGIALKIMADLFALHRLRGTGPRGLAPLWIPLKDLMVLGLWLGGWFMRTVQWRGNRMRVGPGSSLSPIDPAPRRVARPIVTSPVAEELVDEAA